MKDEKMLFLVLIDEEMTFRQLQRRFFMDSTQKLHTALRKLAERGLIYGHPLLFEKKPSRSVYRKLRALNVEIMDKSPPALLWALSKDREIIKDKPSAYYHSRLRQLAKECAIDIEKTQMVRELLAA